MQGHDARLSPKFSRTSLAAVVAAPGALAAPAPQLANRYLCNGYDDGTPGHVIARLMPLETACTNMSPPKLVRDAGENSRGVTIEPMSDIAPGPPTRVLVADDEENQRAG